MDWAWHDGGPVAARQSEVCGWAWRCEKNSVGALECTSGACRSERWKAFVRSHVLIISFSICFLWSSPRTTLSRYTTSALAVIVGGSTYTQQADAMTKESDEQHQCSCIHGGVVPGPRSLE
jgi:hypothetical protein